MLCILEVYSGSVRADKKKERIAKCECECGVVKNFPISSIKPGGTTRSCGCVQRRETVKRNTATKTMEKGTRREDDRRFRMFHNAKHRAKKKGLSFTITIDDIVIPETCPLLGIPLVSTSDKRDPRNPSLDQRQPGKGYTQENIWVISSRANWLKADGTLEEFKMLVENWKI